MWQWGAGGRGEAVFRFVLSALVGSALYLVVIVSLAVARGTLDIDVLRARPLPSSGQLAPARLLSAAFLVMLPMIPFHSWLPRAFMAAPRGVAMMLATVMSTVSL